MGRRQNELRNAAGLILKLPTLVAVQDPKISFYKQILVPSHFWLVPPHFVCSGEGIVPSPGWRLQWLVLFWLIPVGWLMLVF